MKKFYFVITMKLICNQLAFLKQSNEIVIDPNDLILFILANTLQTIEEKTLNCIIKIKKKPKKIFQKCKTEIRKPIQKTDLITYLWHFFLALYGLLVICLCVAVMAFAINQIIQAYALKKNITYNRGGTNFWNINTKSLEKKDRPLILDHKYLIAQERSYGFAKKFFLLKDTGEKTGAQREYSEEKSDLFEFFFKQDNISTLYINCLLLIYTALVGVEFYKESGEKDKAYSIIPIDWLKIEQESQGRYFFYEKDCVQYNDKKITKINIQDIKTKINVAPQLTEYAFEQMNEYFWNLFYSKQKEIVSEKERKEIKREEITESLIDCIKIFPKLDEIQNNISYGCSLSFSSFKDCFLLSWKENWQPLWNSPDLIFIFHFLFSNDDFRQIYKTNFAENVKSRKNKNIGNRIAIIIKETIYESLKNLEKNYCFINENSFLFFSGESFLEIQPNKLDLAGNNFRRLIYDSYEGKEEEKKNYYDSLTETQKKEIKQKLENLRNNSFQEIQKKIQGYNALKQIKDEKTFFETYIDFYPKINDFRNDIKSLLPAATN